MMSHSPGAHHCIIYAAANNQGFVDLGPIRLIAHGARPRHFNRLSAVLDTLAVFWDHAAPPS